MRFRSQKRLALETLEHRTLLAADGLTSGFQHDDLPVNDVVTTATDETVDNNLVVLPGDANRDGEFNQRDLVQLFMAGKYLTGESADWREGDWNGDNVFDQRDLIAALQIGNYTPLSNNAHGPPHQNEGNASLIEQLAAETAERIAADADLQSQLNDEVSAREDADDALAADLATEVADRMAEDDLLNQRISEIGLTGRSVSSPDRRGFIAPGEQDLVFSPQCEEDEVVTGGGYSIIPGPFSNSFTVDLLAPRPFANDYLVSVTNESPSLTLLIDAIVVCLSLTP